MNIIHSHERLADPGRFDLTRLTAAERLFIRRHRHKTDTNRVLGRNGSRMSQDEAATALGLTKSQYNKLEGGRTVRLPTVRVSADEIDRHVDAMGPLLEAVGPIEANLGELCLIARRRSGKHLRELERLADVSRPRYLEMERAGDAAIVGLWEREGYRFM